MENIFSKLIWSKDKSLDSDFCQGMINKFENDDRKKQGTTIEGIDLEAKNAIDLFISSIWEEEDKILLDKLQQGIQEYLKFLSEISGGMLSPIDNIYNYTDQGYQIQKYNIKSDNNIPGYYHWHQDYLIHPNFGARVLTFIWYLNDVKEGGETEFIDGTIIKPEVGKLLIFPAEWSYVHRAKEPISNEKYICTGWLFCKSDRPDIF